MLISTKHKVAVADGNVVNSQVFGHKPKCWINSNLKLDDKSRGEQKLLKLILIGTWMSLRNVMSVVEIFQSGFKWWSDRENGIVIPGALSSFRVYINSRFAFATVLTHQINVFFLQKSAPQQRILHHLPVRKLPDHSTDTAGVFHITGTADQPSVLQKTICSNKAGRLRGCLCSCD